MGVRISRSLLARIERHAAGSPGVEVCGLLFGTPDHIEDARPTANVAADPARFFEIDPAALLRAHREARTGGPKPIGCYHSHPSGTAWPSATDAAMSAGDGGLWLILGGAEARLFRAVQGRAFEAVPIRFG